MFTNKLRAWTTIWLGFVIMTYFKSLISSFIYLLFDAASYFVVHYINFVL